MESEKLKQLTATANDAVKDLDQELKKIAFENILNKLLDSSLGLTMVQKSRISKNRGLRRIKSVVSKSSSGEASEYEEITKKLIEKLDSTKHPIIFNLKLTLDRSLYVLKIAKDELNIDGLISSQISTVLLEKFRIKATSSAVGMALMKAVKYVNRKPIIFKGSPGYKYCIMHEGELYLNKVIEGLKKDGVEESGSQSVPISEN